MIALAAAIIAIAMYVTAEHFQVVPATGALDAEVARPPELGDRSIAIIPVEGAQPEALSQAVALELIRLLVRAPELEIIAPRSALAYASARRLSGKPPPLEVAWFLEVRSAPAGEAVRFQASLLAGGTREPAWVLEETRPESEAAVFIEAVIAGLARHFDIEAPDQETLLQGVEPAVYRDYFAAWSLQAGGPGALDEADRVLDRILEKTPRWAPALAADARNALLRAARGGEAEAEALVDLARDRLEEAQALRPDLAEPFLYSSQLAHRFESAWRSAYDEAQRALELAPGDADALAAASTAAFTLGKFEEGAEQLRRAIALDPLVLGHRLKYGLMLEYAGRHQAAIDAYRELMVIDPDYPGAHAYLGRTLVIVGRVQAAYRHMQIEVEPFWRLYGTVLSLYALDRREEADARLDDIIREHCFEAAVQIAELHAYAGRRDEAFEWLALAVEQGDPGLASLLGNPLMENLADDPRWDKLLQTAGLAGD